jgi:hypothetical protein
MTNTAEVTTTTYGSQSEMVYLNGRYIAHISGSTNRWIMDPSPAGARWATYWFVSRGDALAAAVSYATRGYWTKEVS